MSRRPLLRHYYDADATLQGEGCRHYADMPAPRVADIHATPREGLRRYATAAIIVIDGGYVTLADD